MDRSRADTAGATLSVVATPASTTAVELQRLGPVQLAGIEEGIGEIVCRVMGLLRPAGSLISVKRIVSPLVWCDGGTTAG